MPVGEGRYATTIVSRLLRDKVIGLLNQGATVRSIRSSLRLETDPRTGAPFKFSNQAVTEIRRELTQLNRPKNFDNTPFQTQVGERQMVQSRLMFGSRYQYWGTAHITEYRNISGRIEPNSYEMPVTFGDNRRLTRIEIIERMEGIVETGRPGIHLKRLGEGGNRANVSAGPDSNSRSVLEKITIDNVLISA